MSQTSPRRVLMLAPYFPPRRRVGSLRPFRLAVHLRGQGWTPVVVALDAPGQELTARERSYLEGIEVLRLPVPFDRTTGGRSSSDQSALADAPASRAERTGTLSDGSRTSSVGGGGGRWGPLSSLRARVGRLASLADASIPVDSWWPLLRFHQQQVEALARARRVDAVWSTGDPWSAHLLAAAVARGTGLGGASLRRRLGGTPPGDRGLPWVADFRDPWTLCPLRGAGKPWATQVIEAQVERAIVAEADLVTFTAETATRRYLQHYADLSPRISTIVNGFDAELFGVDDASLRLPGFSPWPGAVDGPFHLLFFGRFRPLSPARPVIAMLAQLRRIDPAAYGQVRVQSVGPLGPEDAEAAAGAGVLDAFEIVPPVPYESSLRLLEAADLLLVSSSRERDDMIPAKLWDYLPARRPVLSLAANDEVGVHLRQTGRGLHVGAEAPLEAARIVAAALRARAGRGPDPFAAAAAAGEPAAIFEVEARQLAAKLARALDGLCAAG